jgi:ATP-dependent DNA ligase
MLAHGYDDKKNKHVVEPFYAQPKLDGVRMLVGKQLDGKKVVMSRTGKEMRNMEHVTDEIFDRLDDGEFIDGENFTFDMSFEDITGICRTMITNTEKHKKSKEIQFHAFDTFHLERTDVPFCERYERLVKLTKGLKNTRLVKTELVKSKDLIPGKLSDYLAEGYEGLMIRNANGTYKLDSRSNDLLKAKQFVTEEYTIVGFSEADGRDIGTVVWVCESKNGTFHVRPRGTLEYRKACFDNGEYYVGKKLTVQYQNLTENGMPRFPVGIAIRDYE